MASVQPETGSRRYNSGQSPNASMALAAEMPDISQMSYRIPHASEAVAVFLFCHVAFWVRGVRARD